MTTLTRHPWRLALPDGTIVNEHDHGASMLVRGGSFAVPILRFSFLTPAGEVGVDHLTGLFYILGHTCRHKGYMPSQRAAYRHWHRYGCYADFGGRTAGGLETYSLGMERAIGGAREFLFVKFPHDIKRAQDVQAWIRVSNGGRGGDSETKVALTGRA